MVHVKGIIMSAERAALNLVLDYSRDLDDENNTLKKEIQQLISSNESLNSEIRRMRQAFAPQDCQASMPESFTKIEKHKFVPDAKNMRPYSCIICNQRMEHQWHDQ